jgi:hypothetical protein
MDSLPSDLAQQLTDFASNAAWCCANEAKWRTADAAKNREVAEHHFQVVFPVGSVGNALPVAGAASMRPGQHQPLTPASLPLSQQAAGETGSLSSIVMSDVYKMVWAAAKHATLERLSVLQAPPAPSKHHRLRPKPASQSLNPTF